MENYAISTRWFPTYGYCEGQAGLCDQVYQDFDQQAEQLSGHDQSYLQLTPGAFRGRFLSAFLGPDVSVHLEFCNQALEEDVCGSPDHYTFGVILEEAAGFTSKGRCFSDNDVFLLPPNGNLHFISPNCGVVMAIAIKKNLFLNQPVISPAMMDWVLQLDSDIGILHAKTFAQRVREDALTAIEGLAQNNSPASCALIGQALVASITSRLALEWNDTISGDGAAEDQVYARFDLCRRWLRENETLLVNNDDIFDITHASRRSVEQSFSRYVSMGPLTYMRIVRLHNVRRVILDASFQDHSIGDIAARHGFWDWSRFTNQYHRQFGELPSTTRMSLGQIR